MNNLNILTSTGSSIKAIIATATLVLGATIGAPTWPDPHHDDDSPCDNAGPFGWPGLQGPPEEIGQWSELMDWPMQATHSSVLRNGKAIVWREGVRPNLPPFLWDPSDHSLTELPGPDHEDDLFCAGHATLPDGRLIVVGGTSQPEHGTKEVHIFDPDTNTWTKVASLNYARWYPTITALPDGRMLAMSGDKTPTVRSTIPEIYDPVLDTWTAMPTADLFTETYPFNFVLPDGRIFYTAGRDNKLSQILDIETATWTQFGTTNQRSKRNSSSAAMYRPGRIVKVGGRVLITSPLDGVEVIDFNEAEPAWRETAPMAHARTRADLVLMPDGEMFVIGGSVASDDAPECAVHAPEIWNPDTETFREVASHQRPRIYHSTAVLLPDGRILAAGSENRHGPEKNAEVYSPPYLFKGARPTIGKAPGKVGHNQLFAVQTPDAGSIASVSLIRPASETHNFDQNQRFLPLTFTTNPAALLVTSPENANLAPPGDYMLFIVNADGVPSVAEFVRVSLEGGSENTRPGVQIMSPADQSDYTTGDVVDLSASAMDDEEGDLTSSIQWQSSLDGIIGDGGTISTDALSVGSHTITASVIDLGGAGVEGVATIGISINDVAPPPPPAPAPVPVQQNTGGGSVSWIACLFLLSLFAATTRRYRKSKATALATEK